MPFCFIRLADISAGMGITIDATRTCPTDWKGCQKIVPGLAFVFYTAFGCPVNTYGAATKTYGLYNVPCKLCQRGLVTAAASSTSLDACVTRVGHGLYIEGSEQASICTF
jgi:hypothetical protein